MPLYEYSCQKCSRKIELLIRGDEKPVCPHCQSTKLTKLLSVVSGHVFQQWWGFWSRGHLWSPAVRHGRLRWARMNEVSWIDW